MSRWFIFVAAAICAAGFNASTAIAVDASARRDDKWEALAKQLDDDRYEVREAATQKLIDVGTPAIPFLANIAESGSPEAAWRSVVILEQMALQGDETALKAVKETIDRLADSSRPGLVRMSSELAERQRFFRHDRAVAQLRRLGGRVADAGDPGYAEVIEAVVLAEDAIVGVDAPAEEEDAELAMEVEEFEAEPALKTLELRAAAFEPIEVTFLDQFREEARDAILPDLLRKILEPARAAAAAGDDVEEGWMAADVEIAEGIDEVEEPEVAILEAVELFAEDEAEAELETSALLDKQWKGGDAGIEILRELHQLTSLRIDNAPLTDKALSTLMKLDQLQALTLRGGQFSYQGLKRLHKHRPELQIVVQSQAMMGVSTTGSPCTIQRVVPESGAAKAGLKNGDIIRTVNGEAVDDFTDLSFYLFGKKPGDAIRIVFERDGVKQQTDVTLQPRPGN